MNKVFIVIATVLAVCGCGPRKSETTVKTGIRFTEARTVMTARGLKDAGACWDMIVPDKVNVHTFFVGSDSALVMYEDKDSGRITAMWTVDKVGSHSKTLQDWKRLEEYAMGAQQGS